MRNHDVASTIFLPSSDRSAFNVYPNQLEEEHRAKCHILRARELNIIYLIGGSISVMEELDDEPPVDIMEIYYIVSDMICARLFCVRMMWLPSCSVDVVPMKILPSRLVPLEALDLPARYGQVFHPKRFQPRLLPVSGR